MLDPMLIAHHGMPHWRQAKFCHIPESGAEPVIWLDPQQNVVVWHPALTRKVIVAVTEGLDAEQFAALVSRTRETLRQIIARNIEELGAPAGYYSALPDIARRIRNGDNSWVQVADETTDAGT